jgi:hypothetical protein
VAPAGPSAVVRADLRLTTAQRFVQAKPVALAYLKALSAHDPTGAQAQVGSAGFAQLNSLTTLRTWFAQIPVGQMRMTATPVAVHDPGTVGVRVAMSARLGPPPLTASVRLGTRVLLVAGQDMGWRVVGDISQRKDVHQVRSGLSLMTAPNVLSTPSVTVVYGPPEASFAAHTILSSAQQVVHMLHAKYGGGVAARHPLIYLVAGVHQGEALAGVKIGRAETPDGWQVGNFAYIDWQVWLNDDVATKDSVVAHELTHVATHQMLAEAPHSLLEGVAMYEEERYLNSLGLSRGFALAAAAYRQGFPSDRIWGSRYFDWGIRNPYWVDACYEDGEAMTAVILTRYGGPAALGRLAAAYRAMGNKALYTPAQVRSAFQTALHVPFDTVVAEARALVASAPR